MPSDEEIKLFEEIMDKGCCQRCALRFLSCDPQLTSFDYPNNALVNFGFLSYVDDFDVEPPSKIKKVNPCSVCLGVLQDSIIEEMLSSDTLTDTSDYETEYYIAHLTIPACIRVRDHSMKLHLKRTFPDCFKSDSVLKINHTWKYTIENRLSKILKRTYSHPLSKFAVHFFVDYALDDDELATIHDLMKKSSANVNLSRHSLDSFLDSVSDEDFSKIVSVPPKIPFSSAVFSRIQLSRESIHLLGNYCKFSRDLLQRNIGSDEEIINKPSVARIIADAITQVLGPSKDIIFVAAGCEPPSVRVLGNGRSFSVKVIEPKVSKVSSVMCKAIENIILKSNVVLVRNLRQSIRKEIAEVFENQNLATRAFKMLCFVEDCTKIDRGINAINMYRGLTVSQKTPIIRLHQRKLLKINKKIYYIKAKLIKDNLFEVELITQNGLNIEEFAHGDMGRTTPSLTEIMKTRVGVLALDLTDFNPTLPCALEEDEVDI